MKSKEIPWTLTKEGPIHEVKKDHKGPKSQKEEKKKEIIIIKKKKGPRLGQAKGNAVRILVRLEDMQQDAHQGPRTLMCPFEVLRRGHWLTYEKAKVYVQNFTTDLLHSHYLLLDSVGQP